MKRMLLKLTLLLGVMLFLLEMPLQVSADELSLSEAAPEQETEIDLQDSESLAEGYINEQFGGGIASAAVPKLKARRITQGSKLTGPNLAAYQMVLEAVRAIAAGERTLTELQLTRAELGIAEKYYYASDLSVTDVLGSNGQPTDEAKAAMNQIIGFDIKAVMNALMADFPYEFYWFDKTTGYVHSSCSYGTNTKTGNRFICFPEKYNLRMSVAPAYAYQSQRYVTNPEETGRATRAAASARSIIEASAAMGDLEKLTAYKDTICELTSYDRTASGSGIYGDPWQMVYVFDGDPETNVVCEGYSKAFQYLCDNSDFSDSSITCNTVTGRIKGFVSDGLHMWNLVSISGENYHTDITNSDTGTAGSRGQLFLAGVPAENLTWQDAEGSILTEYSFSYSTYNLIYKYDADTLAMFSQDELQIADHAYQAVEEVCMHEWDLENPVIKEPTCEEAGETVYSCIHNAEHKKVTLTKALGHTFVFTDWQWQKDSSGTGYTVKAVLTCERCRKTKLIDAEVAVETTEATETESAMFHYTAVASYGDQTFTDQRSDAVPEEKKPEKADTDDSSDEKAAAEREAAEREAAERAAAEDAAGHITLEAAGKKITAMRSDGDLANAAFRTLAARVTKAKKTSLVLKWNKVSGAAGYVIYAAKAGSSRYVKAGEVRSGTARTFTLKKISGKKLKKNTYYKIVVIAYKNAADGKRLLSTAKTIHAATAGGGKGNPAKLSGLKSSIVVKAGKKAKLSVKQSAGAGTKVKKYRAVSFESSNPSVASVTKKGMVKARKKGTCIIYVYAQNGLSKKVKVTVR
ncbi:MAG: Ig-like domain-containing protein [Eubacterium sp.]|nr:Ig-like domain-containing protein [Eubacterium sp.]